MMLLSAHVPESHTAEVGFKRQRDSRQTPALLHPALFHFFWMSSRSPVLATYVVHALSHPDNAAGTACGHPLSSLPLQSLASVNAAA